jgi:hypothetical protein
VGVKDTLHGLEGVTTTMCMETIAMEGLKGRNGEKQPNEPYSHFRQCRSLGPQWPTVYDLQLRALSQGRWYQPPSELRELGELQ